MFTKIKTEQEIKAMIDGGKILATVLESMKPKIVPGVSTQELAEFAKLEILKLGGQPTILGYQGFPEPICVSVNDEVVHGIPGPNKIVADGDIVSIDCCVTYKGMITDSAFSVIAGSQTNKKATRLLEVTEKSLLAGINAITGEGTRVGDISSAIEKILNDGGYGVVRDMVGHGVGHEMHEMPNIPNFGKKGDGPLLKKGMTIAIEPMSTMGNEQVEVSDDGWTIKSKDSSLSAHFEHTVLITSDGFKILTTL
jgi:methionyl aminopeptidase